MNADERRIISDFVARVSGAGQAPQGAAWGAGSVPQSQGRPPLPPVDPEADQMLMQLFQQYPEARYRITQTAFVQEAALVEAQNRIRQLEWEVQNAQRMAQNAPPPAAGAAAAAGGGFFGSLFGGGRSQPQPMPQQQYAPPPPPQYPPGYNPQMLAPQAANTGPSFLGSALRTAAGVAGGVVVGNALMNMFSGHHGAAAAAGAVPPVSPWADPGAAAAQVGWAGPDAGPKAAWGEPDKFAGTSGPYSDPGYNKDSTQTGWGNQGGYDNSGGSGGYGSSQNDGGGYNSGGSGDGGGGGGYDGGGGGGGGSDDQ